MYNIEFTSDAKADLAKLAKSEPKAFEKVLRFIDELKVHPKTGLGHPEALKGKPTGRWSREISKKHRLVYQIFDTEVLVLVLSARNHYDDK
ncbi:MAG: Txe/YoeB family addiction module toxin [Bacteroidales bacterium]|jgi:toxin YoeB|nr:Txe/YoeB family addiction module toxin [Bacteroidales bacterium]